MKVLRSADYRRMPWKNGGGETVEIAVFPPSASVDDLDWRISMATVATDGPFSIFEGVDRTLCVLSGEGIGLSMQGRLPVSLTRQSDPHAFPADLPTSAHLIGGPITDLNVMTRRGRFVHRVRLERGMHRVLVSPEAATTVVVTAGRCRIARDGLVLEPLDAVILEAGDDTLSLQPENAVGIIIAAINRVVPGT
ncbi:HutD family protein [Rhizobium puerariae]|uniref:HutD family protein n=1 Tax=Rhizobium puerariae TaxID=1585791 RepID=A0ABV6AGS9_9HYPH